MKAICWGWINTSCVLMCNGYQSLGFPMLVCRSNNLLYLRLRLFRSNELSTALHPRYDRLFLQDLVVLIKTIWNKMLCSWRCWQWYGKNIREYSEPFCNKNADSKDGPYPSIFLACNKHLILGGCRLVFLRYSNLTDCYLIPSWNGYTTRHETGILHLGALNSSHVGHSASVMRRHRQHMLRVTVHWVYASRCTLPHGPMECRLNWL